MKNLYFFFTVFFVFTLNYANSQSYEELVRWEKSLDKTHKKRGIAFPLLKTYNGMLSLNTFTRGLGLNPAINDCSGTTALSGVGVNIRYEAIPFYVTVDGTYSFNIPLATSGIADSYLFLYCNFNPADPTQNLIAADDDYDGFSPAIEDEFGVILDANKTYYLVTTIFAPGDEGSGDYKLEMRGNTVGASIVLGTYVPAPVVPVSIWSIVISLLLIGVSTYFIARSRYQKS